MPCAEDGTITPSAGVEELSSADSCGDWQYGDSSLVALLHHVSSLDHRYLWELLPSLRTLARLAAECEVLDPTDGESAAPLFKSILSDLEAHMHREESSTFPMVQVLIQDGVEDGSQLIMEIDELKLEHEAMRAKLKRLFDLTDGYRPGPRARMAHKAMIRGAAALHSELIEHMDEEDSLFARCKSQLCHD